MIYGKLPSFVDLSNGHIKALTANDASIPPWAADPAAALS